MSIRLGTGSVTTQTTGIKYLPQEHNTQPGPGIKIIIS